MITVMAFLVIAAFCVTIASATGHAPVWVAVLLLSLVELLRIFPLGR